ncbi:3-deoxy-7-phosphoheptulonate synthase [Thermobifida halotolerans]|uniref:3-deoxy-7-phosphoheptulonate synthase n=1 Tax=Thermobifida halotolerans TaxID=483545 RepID=UPI000837AC38|nr:3-deoxy-7-phosphoheptulonate synthase [Thermobifida halotolerans]
MAAEPRTCPPLVFAGECGQLKERLAAVARGEAFLLQGGDCAETFGAVSADQIRNKLKTLLQMGAILTHAASAPVVRVGDGSPGSTANRAPAPPRPATA